MTTRNGVDNPILSCFLQHRDGDGIGRHRGLKTEPY